MVSFVLSFSIVDKGSDEEVDIAFANAKIVISVCLSNSLLDNFFLNL
jgi:hypothetical protein